MFQPLSLNFQVKDGHSLPQGHSAYCTGRGHGSSPAGKCSEVGGTYVGPHGTCLAHWKVSELAPLGGPWGAALEILHRWYSH